MEIDLRDIDAADRSLAISHPWQVDEELEESVRRFGILTPVEVRQDRGKRFQIVHGFRRLEAARRARLQHMPARLVKGDDEFLFWTALEANRTSRGLSVLEAAAAAGILRNRFDYSEKRLTDEVLPRLGRRGDRRTLSRLLQISALDERLQRAIHQGLEAELALRLYKRPRQLQDLVLSRIERYRLGRNKQREFFELLDELLAASGEDSARRFWRESGLAAVEARGRTGPDRFAALLEELRRLRYPSLYRHRHSFRSLLDELDLPSSIRLQEPPNFEGGDLQILLSVSSPRELSEAARRLARAAESPAFQRACALL
ncbi:MAG TPA: ParB N-terminal domain-containing protein [Acidobacteriota bacterium]|nr:ParB N-terminal domain-containing protein [Acidobacteriota bacterium]